MNLTRRKFLTLSASAATSAFFGSQEVFATIDDVNKAISEFTDGEPQSGALKLKTPEVAENSNSVPVTVTVDSPMTDDDYVKSVMILAEGNFSPEVVTFHFTPASGEAHASARIRLAKTQSVVAVAKTSNGKYYKASSNVAITTGACGG